MQPINKNWTSHAGRHIGGQSLGDGFTIVWQRGSLTDGRNGAFLTEVLCCCLDWIRVLGPCHVVSGIGFTIGFGGCKSAFMHRLRTLTEVLEACIFQLRYYQSQAKSACEEYSSAEAFLFDGLKSIKGTDHLEEEWTCRTVGSVPALRELVIENVASALKSLESLRDRQLENVPLRQVV